MAVHSFVQARTEHLRDLCRKHRVHSLDVFGSAARGDFDVERSDVDLLVEFDDMPPMEYGAAFWALLDDLEALFGRRVDLVVRRSMRNPYFIEAVEATRVSLYAA